MDDQVVLWVQRDADGLERRCAVALIDEGDFELRLWRGTELILQEPFAREAELLDRADALADRADAPAGDTRGRKEQASR
jgi:hypothetical protein